MTDAFESDLGAELIGAEILHRVAVARASGVITWNAGGTEAQLHFKNGRPEVAVYNQGQRARDRTVVVGYVRGFAVLSQGHCSFRPSRMSALDGEESLAIDTLGEVLVATLIDLSPQQIDLLWRERAGYEVEASGSFTRLSQIVQRQGAPLVHQPVPGSTLGSITANADAASLRAWTTVLCLGGLTVRSTPPVLQASPVRRKTTAQARLQTVRNVQAPAPAPLPDGGPATKTKAETDRATPTKRAFVEPPSHPEARALHFEIDKAHLRLVDQNHYETLGVAPDASNTVLRDAYFALAKRWHSDRVVQAGLDPEIVGRAAQLFQAAEEAHRILSDESKRKTYDYILDRQARGLPTDPMIIMRAEDLFSRGQKAIDGGHAAQAEPLLREAVELNPGEAEFWIYWGYSLYCAQGATAVEDARGHIRRGMDLNDKLPRAHEFLGRIARVQGERGEAARHLRAALDMDSKNIHALRELRLIEMRRSGEKQARKASAGPFGLGTLLDKVLRR